MRRVEMVPGLVVDEEMFGAAAAALAVHAPDQPPLTWEAFTDKTRWWLVPSLDDDVGGVPLAYKAEFVLVQTWDLTIKINIWYRPDLRDKETSRPHTHPWEVFEAYPVLGGYEDEHWHRTASGLLVHRGTVFHQPGGVNRIFARDYHEVTSIAEPGRTVSVMICGRRITSDRRHGRLTGRGTANEGGWGHLDINTGCHVPVQRDPFQQSRFQARLSRLNPQHR